MKPDTISNDETVAINLQLSTSFSLTWLSSLCIPEAGDLQAGIQREPSKGSDSGTKWLCGAGTKPFHQAGSPKKCLKELEIQEIKLSQRTFRGQAD